jgi:hypothetical protein
MAKKVSDKTLLSLAAIALVIAIAAKSKASP